MRLSRSQVLVGTLCTALVAGSVIALRAQAQATEGQPVDARIWLGRAAEIETYIRDVQMLSFTTLSVGVTKPQKATLPPGGPCAYLAWKPIQPGLYGGFWESYQNEIAAYELDKVLGLNMIPPTVEKRHRGERGAAIMWVSPSKSFTDLGGAANVKPPPAKVADWNRNIAKAKMFDNLIANIDPNQGNWLVDPAWNLILIDHTRSFTTTKDLTHVMTRVDPDLWAKMQELTEASLKPVIGKLMGGGELRAILQRRDKMKTLIDALVKDKGEAFVFMKDGK